MHQTLLHCLGLLSIISATGIACSTSDPAGTNSTGDSTSTGGSTGEPSATDTGGSSSRSSSKVGGSSPIDACDVKPILQTSCSGIICHGSPGKPAEYYTDLFNPPEGETIEEVLLGKAANYELVANPSSCPLDDPELLINPDAPADSLILKKIMGTHACGVRMPNTTKGPLTQSQIDCFVDWVNAVTGHSGTGGTASGGTGSRSSSSGSAAAGGTGPRASSSGKTASGGTGPRASISSGGASGGASTSGTATTIPPTFETVKTILTENVVSCVGSDCHGGHQGRLNLLVDAGLLGRLTSSDSEVCDMPVVDPGNPSNSALVKLLREGCGDVAPNCLVGTECIPRMPLGCTEDVDCIPENYIKAVEQWIADGAEP